MKRGRAGKPPGSAAEQRSLSSHRFRGSYRLVLNVPNDNNLIGLCIPLQVAYGPTSTAPLGLDLTNGVYLSADVK